MDDMPNAVRVLPGIRAGLGVELARVREQRLEGGTLEEATQHGLAGDMVECADRVYRQDGGAGRGLRGGAQQARDSFRRTCSARTQKGGKRPAVVGQTAGAGRV